MRPLTLRRRRSLWRSRGAGTFSSRVSRVCGVRAPRRGTSWGRGPPPGPSSTEARGVAEGAGPGGASGALCSGAPGPASQLTLLVMHPCGAQDEAAADGVLRPAPRQPVQYLCEVAGDGDDEAGDDEADLLDTSDPPGGGESTASLEDLEDEETHSGGEGGGGGVRRRGGGGGGGLSKTCTYEGCSETTSQVAKQRKPWMCKKHRNKMYKDKYKKKKSDQALSCGGAGPAGGVGNVKLEVPDLRSGVLGSGGRGKKPQFGAERVSSACPPAPQWARSLWLDSRLRGSACPQFRFMPTRAKTPVLLHPCGR